MTRKSLQVGMSSVFALGLMASGCSDDSSTTGSESTSSETGDGDGDPAGDGDGDGNTSNNGSGDGDGDGDASGDGDGDASGDGDGDASGDGDGDASGDGDGDAASCGDGTLDDGEECDLGPDNADDGACTSLCTNAACGDGYVYQDVEVCDDGNDDESDACTTLCAAPSCDDGLISGDESDLDCGGSCGACDLGGLCVVSNDCGSQACIEGVCGYAATCDALHLLDPELGDGTYTIDPDGEGENPEFGAYCDMSTDGGGWTLVFHFYDHTGFSEQHFIDAFGHNRWTDEAWSFDGVLAPEIPALAPVAGQGMIDIDLLADAWDDVRMSCNSNPGDAAEEHFAQVSGYATDNANHLLLGAAANGVTYDVDADLNSFGLTTLWHDNEPTTGNSGHYLCDYTNSGTPAGQFGFCYTDFLNNPNNLDAGDSVVALAFGTSYGPDAWSQGFTGECGDMDFVALLDTGTYSIWVR